MKNIIKKITNIYPSVYIVDISLLVFRISISIELMVAHGLKKLGIGVAIAEQVPNPLNLAETFNSLFANAANLFFPIFVILGFFTRIAVLPILAVTLTGYFVLHWNDSLLIKDTPFIYSICFLLLFIQGSGRYSLDYFINEKMKK